MRWKPVIITRGFKFGGIAAVMLALGGCSGISGLSPDVQRYLREKSAEIGSKDVVLFEMKRRAADKLIERCLATITGPIENSIDCVKSALKLVL